MKAISNDTIGPRVLVGLTLLWLISCAISMQGWRERPLSSDFWISAQNANDFLKSGRIPDHGVLSSFGAYIPPGSDWFLIPGVAMLREPRMYEYPGSAILHLGTILGLFVLSRLYFGARCAWLAAILYSFSTLGLQFAGGLWPRGLPFCSVWFLCALAYWERRLEGRFVAAAIMIWAAGMYYFMEVAPLILCLPWVYWRSRPPLPRLLEGMAALLLSAAIWAPYAIFEHKVQYRDIQSLLRRQTLVEVHPPTAWCNNGATLRTAGSGAVVEFGDGAAAPGKRLLSRVADRTIGACSGIVGNFAINAPLPGAGVVFLVLCLGSIIATRWPALLKAISVWPRSRWATVAASVCALGALLAFIVWAGLVRWSAGPIRRAAADLLVAGVLLLLGGRAFVTNLALREPASGYPDKARRLFAELALANWLVMLALDSGLGLERRFWWLWPIQVIWIALSLESLLNAKAGATQRAGSLAAMALLIVIAANPSVVARAKDWWAHGWSGVDDPEIEAVEAVGRMHPPGSRVKVGYQIAFPPWFAWFAGKDRAYRVGADLDLQLAVHHHIRNTQTCLEGFSPDDLYRIVQTKPASRTESVWCYVDGVSLDGYRLIATFGDVFLYKRSEPSK
jgi:hypothetical protein